MWKVRRWNSIEMRSANSKNEMGEREREKILRLVNKNEKKTRVWWRKRSISSSYRMQCNIWKMHAQCIIIHRKQVTAPKSFDVDAMFILAKSFSCLKFCAEESANNLSWFKITNEMWTDRGNGLNMRKNVYMKNDIE